MQVKWGKWLTSEVSRRVYGRRTTFVSGGGSGQNWRKKFSEFASFIEWINGLQSTEYAYRLKTDIRFTEYAYKLDL
jgi:hypothetical protein